MPNIEKWIIGWLEDRKEILYSDCNVIPFMFFLLETVYHLCQGNYLYGNQISLKILSFLCVLSYFSDTYQIFKENNRGRLSEN